MFEYYVYQVDHIPTGRYYRGKRNGVFLEDKYYLGSGKAWKGILNAHHRDEFEKSLLVECATEADAYRMEEMFVTQRELDDPLCMNLVLGGGCVSGHKHTEESRKKMRDAHKGIHVGKNNSFYGRKHTTESKNKISKSLIGNTSRKGIKHTYEAKLKIGNASKGRLLSKEHKIKLSEGKIGDRNPNFRQAHCNIQGCDRKHNAKGYCKKHYTKLCYRS